MEYLQQPELYIADVLARVKPEYLQQRFGLPEFDPTCHPLSGESVTGEKLTDEEKAKKGDDAEEMEYPPTAKWPIDSDLFLELVSKKTGKLLKVS